MKKVLYASCTKYDAPTRIRTWKEKLGWEPAMVITSLSVLPQLQKENPDVHIHARDDFFTKISPEWNTPLSAKSLISDMEYILPYTAIIYEMMNRYARPFEFTVLERKRLLRQMIHAWGSLIDSLNLDIAHWDETPHGPLGYILYLLCKRRGIHTFWFGATSFECQNLVFDTVNTTALPLDNHDYLQSSNAEQRALAEELIARTETFKDSDNFEHSYMDLQKATTIFKESTGQSKQKRSIKFFTKSNTQPLRKELRQHYFFPPPSNKIPTESEYKDSLRARAQFKHDLLSIYHNFVSEIDLSTPYIYFPLHYQPERTSVPEAEFLFDQFATIATVQNALPQDWVLVVKEHTTQFNLHEHLASEIGRTLHDYEDISSLEHVVFANPETNSALLTRHSKATVTLKGTATWEAAVNNIPGLHFAHNWYDGFPGTRFIANYNDLCNAIQEIEVGTFKTAEPAAISNWLNTLARSTFQFDPNVQQPFSTIEKEEKQAKGVLAAAKAWENYLLSDEG